MIEGYQIIDNFLNQEEFNNYNICFSPEISMTYNCAVADSEDNEFFLLGHVLHQGYEVLSPHFETLAIPLLNKINFKALIRARINWYPKWHEVVEHKPHNDLPYEHAVLLYYPNTNNGFTRLHGADNGKDVVINSVANRVVIFNGSIKHNSTTCSDEHLRCSVNINLV